MLRLAFDFIITWRETRTRPNAYDFTACWMQRFKLIVSTLFEPVETPPAPKV